MDADVHTILHLGMLLLLVFAGGAHADLGHLRLAGVLRGDDVARAIQLDTIGCHAEVLLAGKAVGDSFLGTVQRLDLATFASELLQVLKVALGDRGDVVAAEDTDFKVVWLRQPILLSDLSTGTLQVIQCLVDDTVSTNVLGDRLGVAVVRDELGRRSQVNTIDMSMSVKMVSN